MKRLLIALVIGFASSAIYGAQAHRLGPHSVSIPNGANVDAIEVKQYDNGQYAVKITTGFVHFWPQTIAQIDVLEAPAVGAIVRCSDCSQSTHCVSSGTTPGAFVVFAATGVLGGSNYANFPHCR